MFTRPTPALPTSGCLPNRAGPRPQRGQSLNDGAVDFARRLDQSQSHSEVGLPRLALLTAIGSLPAATFPYKSFATLQGIPILITVGPMSPCVSACSRIFSNWAALLTSPRIASENSFRIIASSRDPRRTCRPRDIPPPQTEHCKWFSPSLLNPAFPVPSGSGRRLS